MNDGPADPRAPLHPQVELLFGLMRAAAPAERVLEATAMRAQMAGLAALLAAGAPPVGREHEIRIPAAAGTVRALVFHPPGDATAHRPILVYLHGGGFVILSPESHARLAKELCVATGAVVVSVDYRLAPEHRAPAALEDSLAAFRFVRANAASLGGDASRVALGGDSAGGQLTAAVTLRLLAAGEAPPAANAMLCPLTDLALSLESDSARRFGPGDPILDDQVMRFFVTSYAPDRASWAEPDLSPLRADLSGFPPTCVVVGGIDPLLDDGLRFAEKLTAARRAVRLLRYDGMPHDFFLFPGLDAGAQAVADVASFLRHALGKA